MVSGVGIGFRSDVGAGLGCRAQGLGGAYQGILAEDALGVEVRRQEGAVACFGVQGVFLRLIDFCITQL